MKEVVCSGESYFCSTRQCLHIERKKKRLCEDKSSVVLTDAYDIAYKIEQAKYYPLRSMISLKPPADAPC